MTRRPPLHANCTCRSCGSARLTTVLAFGDSPLADRLMRPDDQSEEYVAPLTLAHCEDCSLCQIVETVEPRILFGPDYPYFSSVSPALMAHFRASAEAIAERQGLTGDSLVVEAASNDGYMLRAFLERGVPVLGVDPADGPVKAARDAGVDTIHDFFGRAIADRLVAEGRRADVFLANNVLAHVADVNDFLSGAAALLKDDGVAVIEFPWLLDLLDNRAFDTIYHQHLLYISLTALGPLLARHGLHLNDAERLKIHGGSLRITASKREGLSPRAAALLEEERDRKVSDIAVYEDFLAAIARMRRETRDALDALKGEGRRVVGYGAAAKATTLLHYFGIDQSDLDYIVDKSRWKQGLEMPVVRIPIASPERLANDAPEAIVILAWNFANEIVAENREYLDKGGQFIVPVPDLRIVTRDEADAPSIGVSL